MTVCTREQLMEQCRLAAIQVRKMKRHSPYLFPQHARLMEAKRALRAAKAELVAAQAEWDALGNHVSVRPERTLLPPHKYDKDKCCHHPNQCPTPIGCMVPR